MLGVYERDYGGAAATVIKSTGRIVVVRELVMHFSQIQHGWAAVLATTNHCGRMTSRRKSTGIDRFRCISSSARNMSDYKIRPSFNEKFPASKVRELIQNVLKTELAGQQYADDA